MSKLLKNTILLSSVVATTLFASATKELEDYLTNQLENNPVVKEGKAVVIDKKPIKKIAGWDAYIIDVDVTLKNGKKVHQKNIIFFNGRYVSSDFVDIRSGMSIKDKIKPNFELSMYDDNNLIAGDKNAPHKIVIFSDPLCPFCRRYVPKTIKDVQENPKKYALYHYNLPLTRLHPASEFIVKAEIAAKLQGKKIDMYKLYTMITLRDKGNKNYIAYDETDPNKILKVFNSIFHTNLTPKDLESPEVLKQYNKEKKLADELLVAGTPTVYFDQKYDRTRTAYKKVK